MGVHLSVQKRPKSDVCSMLVQTAENLFEHVQTKPCSMALRWLSQVLTALFHRERAINFL